MLLLDELVIMQEDLRERAQVEGMRRFVEAGGFWTRDKLDDHGRHTGKPPNLIYVTEFEDGMLAVHDGHHRVTATCLGGRHFLREDEYVRAKWLYGDYTEVNWKNNYVTPHDPRTEVRLPDFLEYKNYVILWKNRLTPKRPTWEQQHHGYPMIEQFIYLNKDLYCRPRTIRTIAELAGVYNAALTKGVA